MSIFPSNLNVEKVGQVSCDQERRRKFEGVARSGWLGCRRKFQGELGGLSHRSSPEASHFHTPNHGGILMQVELAHSELGSPLSSSLTHPAPCFPPPSSPIFSSSDDNYSSFTDNLLFAHMLDKSAYQGIHSTTKSASA